MSIVAPLVRLLPLPFIGRLARAFMEIVLATLVISTSVVVGHGLTAWRAWYWDPSTIRHWGATPTPDALTRSCPGADGDQLAFARPIGPQCVWLSARPDGTHLVIGSGGVDRTDLGVIAAQRATADVRVYSPSTWTEPVVVATGGVTSATSLVVFTWQQRGVLELLRVGGERIAVADDTGGWPRLSVMTEGGMRMYRWTGATFARSP
ncbi:MAG TPA: hypothetical protein VEU77_07450 [Candidatus Acidoferrales bacterium]|nr:hypothetical protein [Candidatus Acidoferrales bacterium]